MDNAFGAVLVIATSIAACLIARRFAAGATGSLRRATGEALECIGTSAVFLVANVFAAMILILLIRRVTPFFITVYGLDDPLLIAVSALQGLVFKMWWRSAA